MRRENQRARTCGRKWWMKVTAASCSLLLTQYQRSGLLSVRLAMCGGKINGLGGTVGSGGQR